MLLFETGVKTREQHFATPGMTEEKYQNIRTYEALLRVTAASTRLVEDTRRK